MKRSKPVRSAFFARGPLFGPARFRLRMQSFADGHSGVQVRQHRHIGRLVVGRCGGGP